MIGICGTHIKIMGFICTTILDLWGEPEGFSDVFWTYFDYFSWGLIQSCGEEGERHQKGVKPPTSDKSSTDVPAGLLCISEMAPIFAIFDAPSVEF